MILDGLSEKIIFEVKIEYAMQVAMLTGRKTLLRIESLRANVLRWEKVFLFEGCEKDLK